MADRTRSNGCTIVLLTLLVASCVCSGCGSGSPFDYVPVSGRITYEDGTPLPRGGFQLRFASDKPPIDEKTHPRVAIANVDAEGRFPCVTSYKYGDGLIPGKHKVVVALDPSGGRPPIVPKDYTALATTPLVIDTADSPLEINVPRPSAHR